MKCDFWLCVIFVAVMLTKCQSSPMEIYNVTLVNNGDYTFTCRVPSATNITTWTYLNKHTGSVTLRYHNGSCSASPSGIFASDRYSYGCHSTEYQITLNNVVGGDIKSTLKCRYGLRPEEYGTSWFISRVIDVSQAGNVSNSEPPVTFDVSDVTLGHDVTFTCTVQSDALFVNWNKNMGSDTAAMGIDNGLCTTQGSTTFLDNKSEYMYTCNKTSYQVTRLNVSITDNNDMYMCSSSGQAEGTWSNWIIKVQVPVTSVTLEPAFSPIIVGENNTLEFTCTTSTAKPAASVYWYSYLNDNNDTKTQITETITTTSDYDELSVITSTLHFVPTRHHNTMKIFCEASNSVNTGPVKSSTEIMLNVLYKADAPYISQGNEYRVIENTQGTLSCTVKDGNPSPTLSWSCNNFLPTHQSTINSNGNVTTTLTWDVSRKNEGICTCTSTQTNFTTETIDVKLVVFYPPEEPKFEVNGQTVIGDISFIEGTTRSITCTAESKPTPDRYTWSGPSAIDSTNSSTLTLKSIAKEDAGEYTFIVQNTMNSSDEGQVTGNNSSVVNVVVLYGPTVAEMRNISQLEGSDLNISCPYTTGLPIEASIQWTRNVDDTQWNDEQLYISSIDKTDAGYYTCNVSNVMISSGDNTTYYGYNSESFYLDVLYKAEDPFILQGNEYRVIEHTPGTLSCSVEGGNPTPILSWSCNNFSPTNQLTINSDGNVTTTLTWNVSRTHAGTCSCTSEQTWFLNKTANVLLVVLYPPSEPVFEVNEIRVDGDISFIEGTTRSITCTADSKPSTDRYTWTGPSIAESLNNSILTLNNIVRASAGEYKCSVHNTMNPSDGDNAIGINNGTANVVVLYTPMVEEIRNISQLEDSEFTISCAYTTGMPVETSIQWSRNVDDTQWNDERLYISSIDKTDAGYYTCNVSNVMISSGDNTTYIGHNSKSFYLDVLFEATITSFTIAELDNQAVTVNENETFPIKCYADSNPIASITLSYNSQTLKNITMTSLEYHITEAKCSDAGIYSCSARNEFNDANGSINTRKLYVNCFPRAAEDVHMNITSRKNVPKEIVFDAIAHPPPFYSWYQFWNGEWTNITDNQNFVVTSSNLQSTLTIQSVGRDDFTSYKVYVENNFGQMDQFYYLFPDDYPDPPLNFSYIESRTTASSIHLVWTPGFDYGQSQIFYIKYKKNSDTIWTYLNVTDNGDTSMDLELTGLTENTQYNMVILASNVNGNSSEISFNATTLATDNSSRNVGALVGSIIGGIVGGIIMIVIIVKIVKNSRNSGNGNISEDDKVKFCYNTHKLNYHNIYVMHRDKWLHAT